jgi:hypothetical protein
MKISCLPIILESFRSNKEEERSNMLVIIGLRSELTIL